MRVISPQRALNECSTVFDFPADSVPCQVLDLLLINLLKNVTFPLQFPLEILILHPATYPRPSDEQGRPPLLSVTDGCSETGPSSKPS
jgi:hypothetical protein